MVVSSLEDTLTQAAIHLEVGRLHAAEQICLSILPSHSGSRRAQTLNLLGLIALRGGRYDVARDLFAQAVSLDPHVADYHLNLGNVHGCCDRLREALSCFDAALHLEPKCHEAYNGIGVTRAMEGRLEEAEVALRHALLLRPDYAEACVHLGSVLQSLGEVDAAIHTLEHACRIRPDDAEAHFNLGMALLLKGDFGRGLAEYEWRRKRKVDSGHVINFQPLWDGSKPHGKTVVLYCEEGFGDMLQFVRYAKVLADLGAKVVVEAPPPMRRILTYAAGVSAVVPSGVTLPAHDWHAPVMSLPWITRTTLDSIPGPIPYLRADERLVAHWRTRLAQVPGFRVGVCWQGSNANPFLGRHFPPAMLADVASIPGVNLISLQKGPAAGLVDELKAVAPVTELEGLDVEAGGAFMDTAAVIANLDLVITSDTSIAHLAGALGARAWLALPFAPDWRWLLRRPDSPWYPTMRLFRQPRRAEWRPVFEDMEKQLRAEIARL